MTDHQYDDDPDDFQRGLYGPEWVNWQPSDPPVRSGPAGTFPLASEQAAEIADALRRGDAIICWSKCWPCQFGHCPDQPHTWMDEEDITHAGLAVPATQTEWAALAVEKPCGCHCMAATHAQLTGRTGSQGAA